MSFSILDPQALVEQLIAYLVNSQLAVEGRADHELLVISQPAVLQHLFSQDAFGDLDGIIQLLEVRPPCAASEHVAAHGLAGLAS